jgi:small-conductance mechanosensitive channel
MQANDLKAKIAHARRREGAVLVRQLDILQSQIELAQSRVESYTAMVEFESTATAGANKLTGLSARIDELERSLPELSAGPAKPDASAAQALADARGSGFSPNSGLLDAVETLLRLGREGITIEDRIAETQALSALYAKVRAPLVKQIRALNQHANELAAQDGAVDINANRRLKQEFEKLIRQHKLTVDALMPLAKLNIVLQLYVENLNRWNADVDQRSASHLRRVIVQVAALGVLLIAIFVAAFVWRTLTFRYVQDLRRRRQLLRLRKLAVASVVSLVLVFNFTDQLGTLATVVGLAAAGIAVALQNVILSFAGYFFVTGRYGIRVGDRIQLAGVNGDVIEIGLFKLALMELAGDGSTHQPTGRVVVFPNSIVFQANGNFCRQTPGTNFAWNEFKLTLAPECDYRLAEKRLIEVVENVYSPYGDTVQRQYRELERDLNMKLESPRPQCRIRLGQNGIEMTIRYPADTRHAVQVADEISRRVLDAIAQRAGAHPRSAGNAEPPAGVRANIGRDRPCGAGRCCRRWVSRLRGGRRAAARVLGHRIRRRRCPNQRLRRRPLNRASPDSFGSGVIQSRIGRAAAPDHIGLDDRQTRACRSCSNPS